MQVDRNDAIAIAKAFHEAYERLAPLTGYKTREESAVPWDDVPITNRALMANVVQELLSRGVIRLPAAEVDNEAENWRLAVQLGKEQGLREAQALAVAFLRERARKEWAIGHHHSNDILMAAADKLSQMKFATVQADGTVTTQMERGKQMPGYASHVLNQYLAETRGNEPPKDVLDQYQLEMLRYWCSHLEHVLMQSGIDPPVAEKVIREFIYGAVPHPHDAMERERLRIIARSAIATTATPRFTPESKPFEDKFPYGNG